VIVEVTDLRDRGDVRGSPLAVIIVLETCKEGTYHTRASQELVTCLLAGVHVNHKKVPEGQLVWAKYCPGFFSLPRYYAGLAHACARQLIVKCE
jgi:hypothetical protein